LAVRAGLAHLAARAGRAGRADRPLRPRLAALADDATEVLHLPVGQRHDEIAVLHTHGLDADAGLALLAAFAGRTWRAGGPGFAALALRAWWPRRAGRAGRAVGAGRAGLALLATPAGFAALALWARWSWRPRLAALALLAGRTGLAALRHDFLAQLGEQLVSDLDAHRPQARIHGVHEPLDG